MFTIKASDLLLLSVKDSEAHFNNPANRKKIGELTFLDLVLQQSDSGDSAAGMSFGVYLFFNPAGQCAYVGKTAKQGFAERIGSHFGAHNKSMGNVYVQRTLKRSAIDANKKPDYSPLEYEKQIQQMHDHSITMINFTNVKKVEEILKHHGGKFADGCNWNAWVPEFFTRLETVLQAMYCPERSTSKLEAELDHFLIKPKRGRGTLRRIQKNQIADKNQSLAKVIANWF
ncbi:MAG: GIY-YIG nuclease family protein [Candidatus Azotimanducaceae bacterium WSBS_2022_MAG_OTU7]